MDKVLVDKGLNFYNLYKENKISEINSLEFKTWLAQTIRVLETRASKSKLMEVTELIKVFMQNNDSITINQLEMIVAFLQAEYEISQDEIRNAKAIFDLNF